MAGLIGNFVGALLIMGLLTILFERLVGRRVANSPMTGIPISAAIAFVVATILYGFGNANGGPWNPFGPALLLYALAGAVVSALMMIGARKRGERQGEEIRERFE